MLDPIKEQIKKHPDKAIFVNIAGPLTLLNGIRLLDNVYMDMVLHPEELHKLIKMIMESQNEIVKKACELDISPVYYQDDIAASKA